MGERQQAVREWSLLRCRACGVESLEKDVAKSRHGRGCPANLNPSQAHKLVKRVVVVPKAELDRREAKAKRLCPVCEYEHPAHELDCFIFRRFCEMDEAKEALAAAERAREEAEAELARRRRSPRLQAAEEALDIASANTALEEERAERAEEALAAAESKNAELERALRAIAMPTQFDVQTAAWMQDVALAALARESSPTETG